VVTGATNGIGYAAALALAQAGADVIVAGHNEWEGRNAVAIIRPLAPAALVRFEKLDVRSLASVADFARRLTAGGRAVDLLINCAGGIAAGKRQLTEDGFELQLAANYLSHFALTAELLPLLRRSRNPRVVQLSSLGQRRGSIHFDDLHLERGYEPAKAFSQSKLALLMFALELQRRSDAHGWGLLSAAAHPGYARTEPVSSRSRSTDLIRKLHGSLGLLVNHTASEGALPTLFAATAPTVQRGGYYGPIGPFELVGPPGPVSVGKNAQDREAARRLWEISEQLTRVKWPAE
jgi:NAD(P)-dependent dehydrogenase (short-subunit alcohol dehydrogenase family)